MTNQPSPVLTAEERSFLTFLESRIEGWETYNGKPSKPILQNLLSRTADPDTVTLPREVVEKLTGAAEDAADDWQNFGDDELKKAVAYAQQALANTQSQGGEDE